MEKMLIIFKQKYPRTAEFVENINNDYPMELKVKVCISVSVLMAKLQSGYFNKFRVKSILEDLPNEMIDSFGITYLQHFCKEIDQSYMMVGSYENLPKLNVLKPENFVEKLINQVHSTL
jgi:hypothetical protein